MYFKYIPVSAFRAPSSASHKIDFCSICSLENKKAAYTAAFLLVSVLMVFEDVSCKTAGYKAVNL